MIDRRQFSQKKRSQIVLRQDGRCSMCGAKLQPGKFQVDHVQSLEHDGDNADDNLRAICIPCHKIKTKADHQAAAKVDRISMGGRQRKGQPVPGSRNTKFKKLMSGQVTLR